LNHQDTKALRKTNTKKYFYLEKTLFFSSFLVSWRLGGENIHFWGAV